MLTILKLCLRNLFLCWKKIVINFILYVLLIFEVLEKYNIRESL